MDTEKHSWMGDLKERVQLEENPTEFPLQMTFRTEESKEKVKLPHIHVKHGVASPIIHIAPFEEETEKRPSEHEKKSDFGSIIDYLKEKKVLSEEDKERISIILNLTNDIRDMCKDGIDMVKTDVNYFYRLIKNRWQRAVDDIRDIDAIQKSDF